MSTGVLETCGGLGLFLLGLAVMTDGLRALAGEGLGAALRRFTRSPSSGALTGAVATALVQSSSATTVAALGFVSGGLLTFPQALGIVFGANAGTTVTGWLVAVLGFKLDLGTLVLPLVLVGALLRLVGRRRWRALGLATAGFATIFIGIDMLQAGLSGLEGVVAPRDFPSDTTAGRLLLVSLGLATTVVTQSSSAGVAMAITAVSTGTVSFPQAAALVIGMDVGTTVTAILATLGASTPARRTGLAHVVYNLMTGVMAFFLLDLYPAALERVGVSIAGNEELALVGFHTSFNTLGVLLILPFAGPFARLMCRLVPEREDAWTRHLDRALLREPEIALEGATSALREVSAAAMSSLEQVLRERLSAEERRELLAPVRSALSSTRAFLGQVHPGAGRPLAEARQISLIHLLDHLDRLTERCQRHARSSPVDARLEHATADLADLAARLAREQPPGRELDASATEPLRANWKELVDLQEEYRLDVLRRATRGELDHEIALQRMDEMRMLRRMAHHVWRIARHLSMATNPGHAQSPESAAGDAAVE